MRNSYLIIKFFGITFLFSSFLFFSSSVIMKLHKNSLSSKITTFLIQKRGM
jgi:hypothetical protein